MLFLIIFYFFSNFSPHWEQISYPSDNFAPHLGHLSFFFLLLNLILPPLENPATKSVILLKIHEIRMLLLYRLFNDKL